MFTTKDFAKTRESDRRSVKWDDGFLRLQGLDADARGSAMPAGSDDGSPEGSHPKYEDVALDGILVRKDISIRAEGRV